MFKIPQQIENSILAQVLSLLGAMEKQTLLSVFKISWTL